MNETTEQSTLNLDDVEGHGLKEVAAGISTAAIMVAGGAGVAAAAVGDTGATVHFGDKAISAQVATPGVSTIALPDVAAPHVNVPSVNVPTVNAGATARRSVGHAVTTVHATKSTVRGNVVTAKGTVAKVETDTHTTERTTMATATTAVHATTGAVTETATRAEGLASSTLQAEVHNVGPAYTAVVRVVDGDKGTNINTHQANGTITLTSGDTVIATGNVINGLATLTWSGNHGSMVLNFGGDSGHSGATITI